MASVFNVNGDTHARTAVSGVFTNGGAFNLYAGSSSQSAQLKEVLTWLTKRSAEAQHEDVKKNQVLSPMAGSWLTSEDPMSEDSIEPNAEIFREWRDEWTTNTDGSQDEAMSDAYAAIPRTDNCKTLLLVGFPEVGKTVIAHIVIEHLQNLRSKFKNEKPNGICYSYLGMLGPLDPGEMPVRVLRSLLRTLVRELKSIPEEVLELYQKHTLDETSPADSEVFNCLYTLCEKYHDKVYVVIDALDEHIDPHRERLIVYLKRLPANTKVFITSRDIGAIKTAVDPTYTLRHRAHQKDIRLYLEHQVRNHRDIADLLEETPQQSNQHVGGKSLKHQMEDAVISNADHSFLTVKLHVQSLMQPCTPQELEDAIATPPGNTDQLHAKTFSRLKQQRANKVAFARKILTWITYSGKTMSFSELRYVVGLDAEKPNLEHKNVLSVENLTELCVGFVVYYKSMDMFSLTHRTTWKYFQDNRMLHFPDAFDLLSRVSMAHLFAASTSASMRMLNHHLELGHLHTWSMHMARKLGSYVRRAKQIQLADGTESQTRWSGNTSLAWGSPASLHELVCTSLCNEPFREYALHALRCSSTYDIVHRRFYKSERQLENASTLPPKKGTPLHAAAQLGLADAVLEFASDAQLLNEPDPAGKTALSMVMEAGELDLAMSLADMGASVDLNSHAGRNVFLTSVGKGYNALNLRIIEAAKRRLPSTEEKLLFATYEGGTDDVRSAILELRDKRHRGEIMSAALLVAADCCHGALVEQLLYHIPDVNINYADWRGRTALHRAAERNDANTAGLLLTQGAMLEQRCKEGLTAWAEAIRCSGHGEVLHVLTNFRANVNATGNDGVSPLYIAAAGGHYEMVKRMLEFGTDPSIETSFSWTPIHWAAHNGHYRVTQILIQYRANLNALADTGQTPLDLVISSGGHWNFVKNVLFMNTSLAEVVQSRPDELQPEHATSACTYCGSVIRDIHPAYSCNSCRDFTLCDLCIWNDQWCDDHQHSMTSKWRHLDFDNQHRAISALGILPFALCQDWRNSCMLTLLVQNGALPGRAFVPQAHRDLVPPSRLYGDFSDFDESEEEDSDPEPDWSDFEFELEPDWLDSQLEGLDPAIRNEFFELFGRGRRRSIVPGASNPSSRKRRFSSDSETSWRA